MLALPSVKFKDGETAKEFDSIESTLRMILNDMARYCSLSGYDFIITDLLSSVFDDARLRRVSTTHQDGRAADVSVRGWPEGFVNKFISNFDYTHGHFGAISKKDGQQRLIVRHNVKRPDGSMGGDHLHVQIRRMI